MVSSPKKNDENADADFFAEEKKLKDPSMQKVSSVEGKRTMGLLILSRRRLGNSSYVGV